MRAEILCDTAALERIETGWDALWRRLPDADPFTSPAWLLPWWRAFHPGALLSVAVWHDDRLVALAPLYLETGPLGRRLLPLGIPISDYNDVLIDPASTPDAAALLFDALAGLKSRWDLWSAEDLRPGAALLRLATPPGWTSAADPQSPCPVLVLPAQPGTLAAHIPAERLRKWRMARNRTARRSWRLATADSGTLPAALADLFRLHGARWHSRGEPGVLHDAAVRQFHMTAAPKLLEAGLLRLTVLTIDGSVAGVYYGLAYRRSAYAYIGGFDPGFAFESPGTILLGAAIDAAVAEGASEFHFLRGDEPYKSAWGAQPRWTSRRVFRSPP